jgi:hypothetical protein
MNNREILITKLAAVCLLGLPAAALAHDGSHSTAVPGQVRYGQSAMIGGASVRTYVMLGADKDPATGLKPPIELGVEIPRNVFWACRTKVSWR